MLRIQFATVHQILAEILRMRGFSTDRAAACARLFAEATRDGVYTHGIHRFPRFVSAIDSGVVDPAAEPAVLARFGALERWDGRTGPGNLNAWAAMDRAIALGREHGIGCVALGNTNHWMRGGTYGWQAAEAGLIGICWTNTLPNLPAWGGANPVIGNNPLVIAVPRPGGPVVLDLISAMMSLGRSTHQIVADPVRETGVSQMFIALDPQALGPAERVAEIADEVVASLHAS